MLPDEPEMTPWTVIREQEGTTLFYAGSATVDLYRSETARYRDNLATGAPGVWIVLTPSEGDLALRGFGRHRGSRGRGGIHGSRRQSGRSGADAGGAA